MVQEKETISITVTADKDTMLRFKRLLAWLHYNSSWGHSGTVAMSCDGDGWEKVKVEGIDLSEHIPYVHKRMIRAKTLQVEYASSEEWNYEQKVS